MKILGEIWNQEKRRLSLIEQLGGEKYTCWVGMAS